VSDTVAIVSVASSALVGLGGVTATFAAGRSERRWKSREERAVDARKVLEAGAEAHAEAMWLVQTIRAKQRTGSVTDAEIDEVRDILGKRSLKVIGLVGLRYGVDAPETKTVSAWTMALPLVLVALQEEGPDGKAYLDAMERVGEAEKAHFEVTSRRLS
jgi:hypothetical protein